MAFQTNATSPSTLRRQEHLAPLSQHGKTFSLSSEGFVRPSNGDELRYALEILRSALDDNKQQKENSVKLCVLCGAKNHNYHLSTIIQNKLWKTKPF